MYASIEKLMLTEFLLDTLALWSLIYGRRRLRLGRILLAGSLGAVFTGMCALMISSETIRTILAVLYMPFMIYVASGMTSLSGLMLFSGQLLGISALYSAAIHLFPALGAVRCAMIIGGICMAAVFTRGILPDNWHAEAEICTAYGTCRITGIIDTGNRLTEPFTSLPVLVAAYENISGALPKDFDPFETQASLRMGTVAYGGLGGNGLLRCFMPDKLRIEFRGQTFNPGHIWVAVYPGSLPGGHGALIPPGAIDGHGKRRNGGRYKCPATDR